MHYDTSPPLDPDGAPIVIDAQRHVSSARQSAANAESRQRKKELIQRVQELYNSGMNRHQIALKLGISNGSARKYAAMTQQEIDVLDHPARRADRKHRVGEECIPIMYKMMADGHDDVTIISYLRALGYKYALGTLHARLWAISLNHFPKRKSTSHPNKILGKDTSDSPDGPTRYSRMDIFYAVMTQDEGKLSAK